MLIHSLRSHCGARSASCKLVSVCITGERGLGLPLQDRTQWPHFSISSTRKVLPSGNEIRWIAILDAGGKHELAGEWIELAA
jgi:hypothetical protein